METDCKKIKGRPEMNGWSVRERTLAGLRAIGKRLLEIEKNVELAKTDIEL